MHVQNVAMIINNNNNVMYVHVGFHVEAIMLSKVYRGTVHKMTSSRVANTNNQKVIPGA